MLGSCLLLFIFSSFLPFQYAWGNDSTQQELERVKRELFKKQQELRKANSKERSVLKDLDRLDRKLQKDSQELELHKVRLFRAEAELKRIEMNNVVMNREREQLQKNYIRRIRSLYKMSRHGYTVAILESDSLNTALKRAKYLGDIAERDRTLIARYSDSLNLIEARRFEAAAKKDEIVLERQSVVEKTKMLRKQKQQKRDLLASVRGKKSLYSQTLRELEESSTALWALVKREDPEAEKTQKRVIPAQNAAALKGNLSWPVSGRILSRFGLQSHPEFNTKVFRRGIDIEAAKGEPVRAVNEGIVAFADWHAGYGNLVIIDHGSGYYSLYGHLDRVDLPKGSKAGEGQVLGLAGDTGSLKGPKLYFEIRRNGEAQDPLIWLLKR